jgi:hypothetical protein
MCGLMNQNMDLLVTDSLAFIFIVVRIQIVVSDVSEKWRTLALCCSGE